MADIVADAKKKAADVKAAFYTAFADARTAVAKAKVDAIKERAGIRLGIASAPLASVLIACFAVGLPLGLLIGAYIGTKL